MAGGATAGVSDPSRRSDGEDAVDGAEFLGSCHARWRSTFGGGPHSTARAHDEVPGHRAEDLANVRGGAGQFVDEIGAAWT